MTFSLWSIAALVLVCLSVGASLGLVMGAMFACGRDVDVDAQ